MERFTFAPDPYFLTVGERLPRVALAIIIAMLATFVALELAGRVFKASDRVSRRLWVTAGAIALGTGIWSMHFVGMSAAIYPFKAGYELTQTAWSWVIALLVSALLLSAAEKEQLTSSALCRYSLACGLGISAMHFVGMRALVVTPAVTYYAVWTAASVACAVLGCGIALKLFFELRNLRGWQQLRSQLKAAGIFGAALASMHFLAMAAVDFDDHTICLSSDGIDVQGLGEGVAAASIGFLLLMLLITALERRAERLARALTASLKRVEDDLRFITFHDPSTGLPNRLVLADRLKSAVASHRPQHRPIALIVVELDDFSLARRLLTDAELCTVLQLTAARIRQATVASDVVAYVGEQQFMVLVPELEDVRHGIEIAEAINASICTTPYAIDSKALHLTSSIGISLYPNDGADHELVRHAGIALDSSKRTGGGAYSFFEAQMDVEAHETSTWLSDLRLAVPRGELSLHFQPKVHARSGLIAGVEALVRWNHPTRGMVGPVVFIPIAERFGLINEIGKWVIAEACRQMRVWRDMGIQMRVAINVSAIQLRQEDLAAQVTEALTLNGVSARLLTCEITESDAMQETENTLLAFKTLEAAGVNLSIDDFGTGYSSLSYLRKLPVRQLKVDRSFVKDLGASADADAVVKAIVQMAHALRLEVVAEGVETEVQRDVLLALDCDKFQGYLFGKPMPASSLTNMLLMDQEAETSFRPSVFSAAV